MKKKGDVRNSVNEIEKYVDGKKLTLNVKKSKMIKCKKGGRREELEKWEWKGETIKVLLPNLIFKKSFSPSYIFKSRLKYFREI